MDEKRSDHWHVKIKPSLRKKARLFIIDNEIEDQSDFTEKAFNFYIEEQLKKIDTNVDMN